MNTKPSEDTLQEESAEKVPRTSTLIPVIIGDAPPRRAVEPTQPRTQHAFSYRMAAIAQMAALGIKTAQIAQSLGISASRVSVILAMPEVKQMVKEKQAAIFIHEPQAIFRQMAPDAAKVLYKVMKNKDEKGATRVSAANAVLDRAYGKPTQEIKHEGSAVRDLLRQLDEEKKTVETIGKHVQDAEIIDSIDAWVRDNYDEKANANQNGFHNAVAEGDEGCAARDDYGADRFEGSSLADQEGNEAQSPTDDKEG